MHYFQVIPDKLMLLACMSAALRFFAPVGLDKRHLVFLQVMALLSLMLSPAGCICTKSHQKSWLYENKIWTPDRNADKCLPEGKVEVGGNNKIRN